MENDQNKSEKEFTEEFKVSGREVVDKVKKLVREGTARRIIIKNEEGKPIMEIPLVVGAAGMILVPVLAALGALAALLTNCTIAVVRERKE